MHQLRCKKSQLRKVVDEAGVDKWDFRGDLSDRSQARWWGWWDWSLQHQRRGEGLWAVALGLSQYSHGHWFLSTIWSHRGMTVSRWAASQETSDFLFSLPQLLLLAAGQWLVPVPCADPCIKLKTISLEHIYFFQDMVSWQWGQFKTNFSRYLFACAAAVFCSVSEMDHRSG